MKVFITGATGFIGRHLVEHLLREKHEVIAWVRSIYSAKRMLGDGVELVSSDSSVVELAQRMSGVDAVVNLAGTSLFAKRWSRSFKETLVRSRVELTSRMVDAIVAANPSPRVLISASGVGFYGDRGAEVVTERSEPGSDFLADLSRQWEEAAARAEQVGTRVVQLRIGTVLGKGGGALARLVPLYRRGMGGRIGPGSQFMSWIHLDDLVRIIAASLTDRRFSGPINAVAPGTVTNEEFTRTLEAALGRRAIFHAPAGILRAMVGQGATVLLASQRVQPLRLQELGFSFRYSTLDVALSATVNRRRHKISRRMQKSGQPRWGRSWQRETGTRDT